MKRELLFVRKHNKEEYEFYLNTPNYPGETGILGIVLRPYISVETPENGFGYTDTVLLADVWDYDAKKYKLVAYTLHRRLQPYILRALEKQMIRAYNKRCIN
jgi:hypothetical protein